VFYHELQEDERQTMAQGQTPFTFGVEEAQGADEAEVRRRVHEAAEDAAGWLALRGVAGVRADGLRGRLWTDREESGKAYIFLMDRYKVRRESGHNLVEVV
jgi:hypothetical protein